jgi:hypothetical protein
VTSFSSIKCSSFVPVKCHNLSRNRRANWCTSRRCLHGQCSAVELWLVGLRNQFCHQSALHLSLSCRTDWCDHHRSYPFDHFRTLHHYTVTMPSPYTCITWRQRISSVKTKSYNRLLDGTKFQTSLTLHINLSPEWHPTDWLILVPSYPNCKCCLLSISKVLT